MVQFGLHVVEPGENYHIIGKEEGFDDHPYCEGIEELFAEILCVVYTEQAAQEYVTHWRN
jgi:hypothetical protein